MMKTAQAATAGQGFRQQSNAAAVCLLAADGAQGCYGPANSTNHTYCYNSNRTGFDDGEAYCNTLGGHLVSWNR
jgi:hypothetical protein